MCVILACQPNERPTEDVLTTCWSANPDGGGFMWSDGHMVHGRKGFMTLDALLNALTAVPDDAPLAIHMRIGTSGGYDERVTHPYPVTDSLAALHATEWASPLGIAHNGVIPGMPTDDKAGISDTVAYVRDVVAPLAAGGNLISSFSLDDLEKSSAGSRLCIMTGKGGVALTGSGWNSVAYGIKASNKSWMARKLKWSELFAYPATDLPGVCVGCDCFSYCEKGCPYCYDVALELGYTPKEYDDAWHDIIEELNEETA